MNISDKNEEELIKLIHSNPIDFMRNCHNNFEITGKLLPICKYIQLSILQEEKKYMTEQENELLISLRKKYGSIHIEHFISIKNKSKNVPNLKEFKEELKEISREIKESVQITHNQDPTKGHAAFLEYVKAIAKNVHKDKGIKYNFDASIELYECFKKFNGKTFKLSEQISIKLKPKGFIHILIGHIEKYLVPRTGKSTKFTKVENWHELLRLISKVIDLLSDELVEHFTNNQSGFDKHDFEFENCRYGIHLNKNREIKTFYEIENTSANTQYKKLGG